MPIILNIDTATEHAGVCISEGSTILATEKSLEQRNHASFLQPAIKRLFSSIQQPLSAIDAIAVTAGPGSYTGLRVGLSSAKGLCYALGKSLILINTLEVMAYASIQQTSLQDPVGSIQHLPFNPLFCPMIDARRMEVFTAMYDDKLNIIIKPSAVILEVDLFAEILDKRSVYFSGSGSLKFKSLQQHPNSIFNIVENNVEHLPILAAKAFKMGLFGDLAYCEPFYLKEFFTPLPSRQLKKLL